MLVIMWSTASSKMDLYLLLFALLSAAPSALANYTSAPNYPGGVYSPLNQQVGRPDSHFHAIPFCERFMADPMVTNLPSTLSLSHSKRMVDQHMAVMRCVILTEIAALPHNLFQDFRGSVTEIRRDGVWGVKKLLLLPFQMMFTVSSVPFRIFKELLRLTSTFVKAHKEIYTKYNG